MESQQAVTALSALAQETRLEVFRLLVRRGPQGMAAGEAAARLDIPAPTLSFHLKELRLAGLVRRRREGRSVVYRPDFEAMNTLLAFLTRNCCEEACPTQRRNPPCDCSSP